MKTLLSFFVLLSFSLAGFGQDNSLENKKSIEQIQSTLFKIKSNYAKLNGELLEMNMVLTDQNAKQDSTINLITNADSKVNENMTFLNETNRKIEVINAKMDAKSERIHQGKINLMIILAAMGLGILILFVFVLFRQIKNTKKLNQSIAKSNDEIIAMFNSLKNETQNKLSENTTVLSKNLNEAKDKFFSKLDETKSLLDKEVEESNELTIKKLSQIDGAFVQLSASFVELKAKFEEEIKNTSQNFDGQITKTNTLFNGKTESINAQLNKEIGNITTTLNNTLSQVKKQDESVNKIIASHNKELQKQIEDMQKQIDKLKK